MRETKDLDAHHDAQCEQETDHEHVEQRNALEDERIGGRQRHVGEQRGREGRRQRVGAEQRHDDHQRRRRHAGRDRQVAARERPQALGRMQPVGREVDDVVDHVGRGGGDAQRQEGERGSSGCCADRHRRARQTAARRSAGSSTTDADVTRAGTPAGERFSGGSSQVPIQAGCDVPLKFPGAPAIRLLGHHVYTYQYLNLHQKPPF